jgi:hyperosmotically inducible protein
MNYSSSLKLILAAVLTAVGLFAFIEKGYSISASFAKRDDVITAQLQAKIAGDPMVSQFSVDINTINAVVSIRAVVETTAEANQLVILANSIAGVNSVDASGIVVKPPKKKGQKTPPKPLPKDQQFSADSVLSSEIVGLYIREGLIDAMNPASSTIQVKTKQGVVYLSGMVKSDDLAAKAVALAQGIKGVVRVESSLKTAP